jgi:hypothetical protein
MAAQRSEHEDVIAFAVHLDTEANGVDCALLAEVRRGGWFRFARFRVDRQGLAHPAKLAFGDSQSADVIRDTGHSQSPNTLLGSQ